MSCDNCDCYKCKLARKAAEKFAEKARSLPNTREVCQCGQPKYWDAACCETCWKRGDGYPDR